MSRSIPALYWRISRSGAIWVVLLTMGLAAGDDTHPRYVAARGPEPGSTIWEPAIGVGPNGPVVAFNVGPRTSAQVGYAVYDPSEWTEGLIYPTPNKIDPSIAFDRAAHNFLVAGMPLNGAHILTARIPDDPQPTWTPIHTGNTPVDKPWMVAGEATKLGQECYVVAWQTVDRTYVYQRSTDGGHTWKGGEIVLNGDPKRRVAGTFCAQPAAVTDPGGPVYVAYVHENHAYGSPPQDPAGCRGATIHFLRGDDIDDPNHPNDGEVEFRRPYEYQQPTRFGPLIERRILEVSLICGGIKNFIPLRKGVTQFGEKLDRFVPQLAVDPSDAKRLYLVYHDVRRQHGQPTRDVNVYLRKLTRTNGGWVLGPHKMVNRNADTESDQFLPAVTVDGQGRIHVIFYDDRHYDQQDGRAGPSDPEPRFDVYYAVSDDQGENWSEKRLVLEPVDEPAVNFGLDPLGNGFVLGEYVGISWHAPPGGGATQVWTAFTGTLSTDDDPPGSNKSVIYYSHHTYANP